MSPQLFLRLVHCPSFFLSRSTGGIFAVRLIPIAEAAVELGGFRRYQQDGTTIGFRKISRERSDAMVSVLRKQFSLLLGLDLRERLLSTLLQLCANFGVMESRGTLLRVSLSHKDLADLVGASRPRVTEQLAELERERLLIRQGRQLIVCLDKIANSASVMAAASASFAKADAQPHLLKQLYSPRLSATAASAKPLTREPSFSPVARPVNNSSAMA